MQPIALRDFTTADGLASARVPAGAGWNCGGTQGAVECYNDTRGELTLGIPAILCVPGSLEAQFGVCPINAELQASDQALASVWPQVRNLAPGGALTGLQITR